MDYSAWHVHCADIPVKGSERSDLRKSFGILVMFAGLVAASPASGNQQQASDWSMADVVDVLTYAQSLLTGPRPPILGYYGRLRNLESSASAGGLTVSGSAAGGSSERAKSGKPLTRPLRSWGEIKAQLAEEE